MCFVRVQVCFAYCGGKVQHSPDVQTVLEILKAVHLFKC